MTTTEIEAGTVVPFKPRPKPEQTPTPPSPATPAKKRASKTRKQLLSAKISKAGTAIDDLYTAIQELPEAEADEFARMLEPLMAMLCVQSEGVVHYVTNRKATLQ